jgi:hypothetical protein
MERLSIIVFLCVLSYSIQVAHAKQPETFIQINENWDVLKTARSFKGHQEGYLYRQVFLEAAERLEGRLIWLAGVEVTGKVLSDLAQKAKDEPFVRVVREGLRRPVDLHDFSLFLDDLLLAYQKGLTQKTVWVPPGRARKAGILLHPQDVFKKNQPRNYAQKQNKISIDETIPPIKYPPAKDGDPLGPNWTARYKAPGNRKTKLEALKKINPSGTYVQRIKMLITQLEQQGCEVYVYSTVRDRRRGYLMWGAYLVSRQKTKTKLSKSVRMLKKLNRRWKLNVPIRWMHPGGWKKTREAARLMADAYNVVYATKRGASKSKHYDGEAVDLVAHGLPRQLTLIDPQGNKKTFDFSAADQSRDLSLTPELIDWIEDHFQMKKVRSDYPHWDDKAPSVDDK